MSKLSKPTLDPKRLAAALDRQKKLDLASRDLEESDPHAKARARKGALVFTKPSRTVRSQAYETDINNMVKGVTPFTQRKRPAFYIDETVLPLSYEAQFNAVLEAQEAFMQFAPEIREKFKNDPSLLAKAIADPRRHDELRELGVLEPLPTYKPPAKPNAKGSETPQPKPPAPLVGASEGG